MRATGERGFAIITVLGVVLIVAAVALTLASTMRVEALQVLGDRKSVELDELSRSGQEMALYLESRGFGSASEDLSGLPIVTVRRGFHYTVRFPNAEVDLYLDAEDGKLNLSTAPDLLLENFFTIWSGERARGGELAAAAKDWRDTDAVPRPGGAETETYARLGYAPRNGAFGLGDAGLLRGLAAEDFRDQLVSGGTSAERRRGLAAFLTQAPVGLTINPNFAAELVLRVVPGLSAGQVERIVTDRQSGLFRDAEDLARRVGLPQESPAWTYLHFTRRVPGTLAVARSEDGRVVRSERRVTLPFSRLNLVTGTYEVDAVHGVVERNFPLESGGLTLP